MTNLSNHKICFFNSTKSWGGGEKWHFETSVYLVNKGYNIVVFTNKNSELFKKLSKTKINVIPIKVNNLSFLNIFRIIKLRNIFRHEHISTIIMNLSADVKFAGIAAKLAKIQNIVYRRGSAIPIKNTLLNRFLFKNILTNILANSIETKNTINQNYAKLFPQEKIEVIYNGIDLEKFDNQTKEIKPFDLNLIGNEIIIGNAGRLEFQKNQKDLIKIAKILKSENQSFKILIAGTGRLKEELKQLAKNEGVDDNIIFLNFVEDIKSFMQKIDIFVLTSFWEGFGYVIVEAMACKKAVVAYNISSNPEIVNNNINGFLVNYPDVKEFAEKIKILIENKNQRILFGEKGRKLVEQNFQLKNQCLKIEIYLKSLIKNV